MSVVISSKQIGQEDPIADSEMSLKQKRKDCWIMPPTFFSSKKSSSSIIISEELEGIFCYEELICCSDLLGLESFNSGISNS